MTQEEKQLLLTDLYARLSYGFTLYRKSDDCIITIKPNDISSFAHFLEYSENEDFKPYLRPMSSMTIEEHNYYNNNLITNAITICEENLSDYLEFMHSHHFDDRGLIEKGLAVEAPEDMYNTKTEY